MEEVNVNALNAIVPSRGPRRMAVRRGNTSEMCGETAAALTASGPARAAQRQVPGLPIGAKFTADHRASMSVFLRGRIPSNNFPYGKKNSSRDAGAGLLGILSQQADEAAIRRSGGTRALPNPGARVPHPLVEVLGRADRHLG
jgi:hypothetical protein